MLHFNELCATIKAQDKITWINAMSPTPWSAQQSASNCIDILDANGKLVAQVISDSDALSVELTGINWSRNASIVPARPRQDPCQALPKFRHNPMPNFSGRPIKGDDI